MPATPPLRAFVFDAYGTLFDTHSVAATGEALFPGQGAALSSLWRTMQLEYTWLRSLMVRYRDFWRVTEDALHYACATLGLAPDASAIAQLMESYLHLTPYPEVADALMALTDRTLVILSNGTPNMLHSVVSNNGLDRVFAHVFSVDSVGVYKPDPRVYGMAASRLNLAPLEIGFVSSNGWDIAGASAYGFRTFWINRSNVPLDLLDATPTAIIRTLRDLVPLVAQPT